MKILLVAPGINPNGYTKYRHLINSFLYKFILPPQLSLIMLATVTPEKYTLEAKNEFFQKINFNEDFDLVGITTTTPTVNRAYEIADEFRKRGITVVLGGWHSSALPLEAKQHADAVIIGEAENTWPILLQDLKNKKLQDFYIQKEPVDLKKIPYQDRKRIKQIGGAIISSVQATRGCVIGCHYCSITNNLTLYSTANYHIILIYPSKNGFYIILLF